MAKKLSNSDKERAKKIGQVIILHLRSHHLSQLYLSQNTGIPPTTISSYVRGVSIPSFENLEKICNVLDISMDNFNFGPEPNRFQRRIAIENLKEITYNQTQRLLQLTATKFDEIFNGEEEYDGNRASKSVIEFGDNYYIVDRESLSNDEANLMLSNIETFIEKEYSKYFEKVAIQKGSTKEFNDDEE